MSELATWCAVLRRGEELDELIASGYSAASPRLCAERSRQLVRATCRSALAQELEGKLALAAAPRSWTSASSPLFADLRCDEVRRAAGELRELAESLRDVEPPQARGVALALLLLRDGRGPLYVHSAPGDIAAAAQTATLALRGELASWTE